MKTSTRTLCPLCAQLPEASLPPIAAHSDPNGCFSCGSTVTEPPAEASPSEPTDRADRRLTVALRHAHGLSTRLIILTAQDSAEWKAPDTLDLQETLFTLRQIATVIATSIPPFHCAMCGRPTHETKLCRNCQP